MTFRSQRKFISKALLLAIISYITGLLTAPKSGKETRKDMVESFNASRVELEKKLKTLHLELKKHLDFAQIQLLEATNDTKSSLKLIIENARSAENKVKETLSAVHEGTADNKELEDAIKDAKKAIKHFKKYIAD